MGRKPNFGLRKPSAAADDFVANGSNGASAGTRRKKKASGRSDVRTSGRSDVQTFDPLGRQGPSGTIVRADGREVKKLTMYVPPDLAHRVKVRCAVTGEGLSSLVTRGLEKILREEEG